MWTLNSLLYEPIWKRFRFRFCFNVNKPSNVQMSQGSFKLTESESKFFVKEITCNVCICVCIKCQEWVPWQQITVFTINACIFKYGRQISKKNANVTGPLPQLTYLSRVKRCERNSLLQVGARCNRTLQSMNLMQRNLLIKQGARCSRTRCKWDPVYFNVFFPWISVLVCEMGTVSAQYNVSSNVNNT